MWSLVSGFFQGPSSFSSSPKLCCCCWTAKSWAALCNPMDCSSPGFPVLHYLLELAQIHVHWVGDSIQPSHPLPLPFLWLFPFVCSFFIAEYHSVARLFHISPTHSPTDGNSGCFKHLAIMSNASMNIYVHFLCVDICFHSSWIKSLEWNRTAELFGEFVFNFWETDKLVSQSGSAVLYPPRCRRFSSWHAQHLSPSFIISTSS